MMSSMHNLPMFVNSHEKFDMKPDIGAGVGYKLENGSDCIESINEKYVDQILDLTVNKNKVVERRKGHVIKENNNWKMDVSKIRNVRDNKWNLGGCENIQNNIPRLTVERSEPFYKKGMKKVFHNDQLERDGSGKKECDQMTWDVCYPGWTRRLVQRQSGQTAGKCDVYFYSPEGKLFRSKTDLMRHIEKNSLPLDITKFNFSKRDLPGSPLTAANTYRSVCRSSASVTRGNKSEMCDEIFETKRKLIDSTESEAKRFRENNDVQTAGQRLIVKIDFKKSKRIHDKVNECGLISEDLNFTFNSSDDFRIVPEKRDECCSVGESAIRESHKINGFNKLLEIDDDLENVDFNSNNVKVDRDDSFSGVRNKADVKPDLSLNGNDDELIESCILGYRVYRNPLYDCESG